jgi:hypothetical protein
MARRVSMTSNLRVGLLAALLLAGNPCRAQTNSPVPAPATEAAPAVSPLGPLPAGWTFALTDVIAVYSAPSDDGSITIVAPPVMALEGDVRAAIIERAPALIEDLFGEARPAGEPVPLPASDSVAPGLMVPLVVALEDGSEARVEATGYPLPGKRLQLLLIALPSAMSADNAALMTARSLIDRWRSAGLAVNDDLTSRSGANNVPPTAEDGPDAAAATGAEHSAAAEAKPDDNVEDVIYFLRFVFDGAHPAAATTEPAATTALLLKDGRIFEGETRAPADFDPATRPPGTPGTGRWQRDGEAYALAFSDGTQGTAVAGAAKTLPAPAAMALVGTYRAIGGPPAGLLSDEIDFFPDGSLLLKESNHVRSGTYAISQRTARIGTSEGTQAFLFGFRGGMEAPELLILGNRIYERSGA